MKKIKICIAVIGVIVSCALCACAKSEPLVVQESETCVVIKVSSTVMDVSDGVTLLDYMAQLKKTGDLDYEMDNTMVVTINGVGGDANSYWLLYTSDEDFANSAWGTAKYNDGIYGSSMFGAEALAIKEDCLYIWVYQTF